jgi:hypothetical protein
MLLQRGSRKGFLQFYSVLERRGEKSGGRRRAVLSLLDGWCTLVEDITVQKILLVGALGERWGC